MPTFGSLFAGIGGLDLGLERAGWTCRWQVEIDPFCQRVLAKHWPGVARHGDVRSFPLPDTERVDLICGGFPCQPVSVAGKRLAQADERWLWPEFSRVIRALRPRFVLVENVPGLLIRGFGDVVGDLATSGYDAEWDCIPAAAVGAHHRRDRVWLVAYAHGDERSSGGVGQDAGADGRHDSRRGGQVADAIRHRDGAVIARNAAIREPDGRGEEVAEPDGERRDDIAVRYATVSVFGRGDKRPPHSGGEWWATEPDVGRVAHGLSLELDLVRGLMDDQGGGEEAESAASLRVGGFLRAVWEHQALAAPSPDIYLQRLRDSVPGLPHGDARSRWLLGARLQANEGLRDLWAAFYAQPLKEAHDLQRQLLERIGKTQRPQALGSRVDRLRSLGNAVVPQVAEWIGRRLMAAL